MKEGAAWTYHVPKEIPLPGSQVVQADAPVQETAQRVAWREGEGLAPCQRWGGHRLAGGGRVVIFGWGLD